MRYADLSLISRCVMFDTALSERCSGYLLSARHAGLRIRPSVAVRRVRRSATRTRRTATAKAQRPGSYWSRVPLTLALAVDRGHFSIACVVS